MAPALQYIIASSPRTGSYLLCEGLEATGIAGRPTEVFSPEFQYLWRRRWGLESNCDFAQYLRCAIHYGTTPNGVYGVKIHWMHVQKLAASAGFAEASILERFFPAANFIHIRRSDRRGQALSYLRALVTNEWWRIEGVCNDQQTDREPVFDANAVIALERQLTADELAWKHYLSQRNCSFLTVEYEALTADYRAEIARVLEYLGLDPSAAQSIPAPRLVRQADELTEHWRNMMPSPKAKARCVEIAP